MRVPGLQLVHWGVGCAMLRGERLRSKASLTGRCFWWRSWIPKPAVAFPVWSPHIRATVENAYPELTDQELREEKREVDLKSVPGDGRSEPGPETGTPNSPPCGSFPGPIPFPAVERRKDKRFRGRKGIA